MKGSLDTGGNGLGSRTAHVSMRTRATPDVARRDAVVEPDEHRVRRPWPFERNELQHLTPRGADVEGFGIENPTEEGSGQVGEQDVITTIVHPSLPSRV